MTLVLADTSFYQALLNPRDRWHKQAYDISRTYRGQIITSEYILCELGALMSHGHLRGLFLELVDNLQSAPYVEIIPASHTYFENGFKFFGRRLDKDWSLTDCISFVIMQELNITEALSCDHHFEQAGFHSLLSP